MHILFIREVKICVLNKQSLWRDTGVPQKMEPKNALIIF